MSTASLQSSFDQVEADRVAEREAARRADRARLREMLTSIIRNTALSIERKDFEITKLREQIAGVRKVTKATESHLETGIVGTLPLLGGVDARETVLALLATSLRFLEGRLATVVDARQRDAAEQTKRTRELESLPLDPPPTITRS